MCQTELQYFRSVLCFTLWLFYACASRFYNVIIFCLHIWLLIELESKQDIFIKHMGFPSLTTCRPNHPFKKSRFFLVQKVTQYSETNGKLILINWASSGTIFFFRRIQEFWTTIFQKLKNQKFDFSFVSEHCATFWETKKSELYEEREGGVLLTRTRP